LRTIGRPQERFREDYLRLLRAVRFSTQLGFAIAPKTFAAICENAANITKISGERISMELEGILTSPNRAKGIALLAKSGFAATIFPKVTSQHFSFAVKVLAFLPSKANFCLALSGLFAGCETESEIEELRILKLSRNQIKHIKFLLAKRGRLLDEKLSLAELKMLLGGLYFWDLYYLQFAIQKAENKGTGTLVQLKKRIKALGDVELRPKPLLNGHELIKLGAEPGPLLGRIVHQMYIAQLETQIKSREDARRWVLNWLRRHNLKAN
jgi:poly(A) polymerase